MVNKKIKIINILFLLSFMYGCNSSNDNAKSIDKYHYKGLGVFYYFEIDSGSYYDMIFIPFHIKGNSENPKEISKQRILQNAESIIFESGLGFGTFRDKDIFDEVFLNSEPCETKKYCFAYVDFVENNQKEIKKWDSNKKELSLRICINNETKIVKYYHTQNPGRNLIKINRLKILK